MSGTFFISLTSAQEERSEILVRADIVTSISIETQDGVAATWVELLSGTAFYVTETPAEVLAKLSEAYAILSDDD